MIWLSDLAELVDGRSVALVGNSDRILRDRPAEQVDAAGIVVRMNLGLPTRMPASRIGARTDIWATAKHWRGVDPPPDCQRVLWMKLTELGQKHLAMAREQKWEAPIDLWPLAYEKECREFVGADPGTGIRLLWWLKTKCEPRSVSVYGMDCWERPSHWSGKRNTPNHSPSLERAAMMRLL